MRMIKLFPFFKKKINVKSFENQYFDINSLNLSSLSAQDLEKKFFENQYNEINSLNLSSFSAQDLEKKFKDLLSNVILFIEYQENLANPKNNGNIAHHSCNHIVLLQNSIHWLDNLLSYLPTEKQSSFIAPLFDHIKAHSIYSWSPFRPIIQLLPTLNMYKFFSLQDFFTGYLKSLHKASEEFLALEPNARGDYPVSSSAYYECSTNYDSMLSRLRVCILPLIDDIAQDNNQKDASNSDMLCKIIVNLMSITYQKLMAIQYVDEIIILSIKKNFLNDEQKQHLLDSFNLSKIYLDSSELTETYPDLLQRLTNIKKSLSPDLLPNFICKSLNTHRI